MIVHGNIFNKTYDFRELDAVLSMAKFYKDQHPLVNIYLNCYYLLSSKEPLKVYPGLYDLTQEFSASITKDEFRDIFLLLINFHVRYFVKGNTDSGTELFKLYKQGLKEEILLKNGKISPFTLKNIISSAIYTKEFNWAEGILNQYKNKIDSNDKNSVYAFYLVLLYYNKKDFDGALEIIRTLKIKDLYMNLSSKVVQIKIMYELGEREVVFSLAESLRLKLLRENLANYHKTNYNNFAKLVRNLSGLNFYDKDAIKALKQKIEDTEVLADRKWLLKMLSNESKEFAR